MRLDSLHNRELVELIFEGETSQQFGIDEILDGLGGKVIITIDVKATGFDPDDSQVIKASAVALDANTSETAGSFDMEALLNLTTLRTIDLQDQAAKSNEWETDKLSIKDMLNFADYDLSIYQDGIPDLPDELAVVMEFKSFIDRYADKAILVGYDVSSALAHVNSNLSSPITGIPTVDIPQFIKLYFMPVLQAMAISGLKKANDMLDKLSNISITRLAAVLGVKAQKWQTVNDAENLSRIFAAMLRFLKVNRNWFKSEDYLRMHAASSTPESPENKTAQVGITQPGPLSTQTETT